MLATAKQRKSTASAKKTNVKKSERAEKERKNFRSNRDREEETGGDIGEEKIEEET